MQKESFENVMYEYTEWPGDLIPFNDLHFISDRYKKVLNLCESKDILEIGAGSSIAKKEMVTLANSYTGIDISKKNISRLSNECENLNLSLYVDNAESMQFKDNSFDLVIALAMVYYLDTDKFLSEVKRVLRPGGTLFFCTSNIDVPGFQPALGSKNYLSIEEWNKILKKYKFSPEFEGVFPLKSFIKLGLRAKIISFIKPFIVDTLKLNYLWSRARVFSKGSLTKIPKDLYNFPKYKEESVQIKEYENNIHKVIYCKSLSLS